MDIPVGRGVSNACETGKDDVLEVVDAPVIFGVRRDVRNGFREDAAGRVDGSLILR